jgi:NitT/TauT family transport system permease protein
LMLFGVFPTVCLDAYLRAKKVPQEELQTAQTLDASGFETVWLVVFPRIFPEMLDTIRLNFKSMAALLLMGEALAATEGLGYRIFVVRRYMAMDVIIPYVILITLFLYLADFGFQQWVKRFRWAKS